MRRYLLIFALICVFAIWLLADTTGDLRPIADGGTESGWDDGDANDCSTVSDCWEDVNDSSGGSCSTTPSDGDTTHIVASSNGDEQTFDIDESSIPNGDTVESAVVRICARKVPAQGTSIRVRFVINGTPTDSGNIGLNQSYTDHNATIDFADDVKDGSDDYEIGVELRSNREARVSAIETDITFSAPAAAGGKLRIIKIGGVQHSRKCMVTLRPGRKSSKPVCWWEPAA